jgi:hypothetical protein
MRRWDYPDGRARTATSGDVSSAPKDTDSKAKWLDYDTRHVLAELPIFSWRLCCGSIDPGDPSVLWENFREGQEHD